MSEPVRDLEIRRARPDDLPAVMALLRVAMGRGDDERFVELFRWKHFDNAFGASPAWVAVDGDRLAAVRYLMRWQFERADQTFIAVRAVDTATHPDYQGRGLFTKLTLGAIDDLRGDGVDFVFNTPNDQSRPGYLKMGWQVVGKPAVPARPLSLVGLVRMARARVPAEHFSAATSVGEPAAAVLADTAAMERLLAARPASPSLRTLVSQPFLQWRYGGELLQYRAVTAPGGIDGGVALFRIRPRGPAREAALTALLVPHRRARAAVVRAFVRAVRRDADYAVALGKRPSPSFVPLPGAGPTLTWRAVLRDAQPVALHDWDLTLGDIELF